MVCHAKVLPGMTVYAHGKRGIRRWLGSRLAERARGRRHETYRALVGPRTDDIIIDIGCGAAGLAEFEPQSQITGVDLPDRPPGGYEAPHRHYVQSDARALPFADKEFDIAYSNSLIEHLEPSDRPTFAREVTRVAKRYFVQTPNRWFPVEPHLLIPFFQHLPAAARRRLWRFGVATTPFEEIQLLDARELKSLFPDALIVRERIGPLTKSVMAIGPGEKVQGMRAPRGDRTGIVPASKRLAKRVGVKRVYGSLRATLVGRREPQQVWSEGVPREVAFWRRVLPDRVATDAGYKLRADPMAPISDPLLKMLIARIPDENLSIIDVGAGPLTSVGKTYPGKTVSVTATDPLAPEYARIMQDAGIEPPVPPIACRGEDLLNLFRPGTFDLAFARNALDHCVDPVRVIRNMVQLVKEERFVVLRHRRREANTQLYRGLHQWNFDIEDGGFVIWRTRRDRVHLDRVLGPTAKVNCFEEGGWVVCLITKRPSAR
jgi:SAM-dependent methyltransferase